MRKILNYAFVIIFITISCSKREKANGYEKIPQLSASSYIVIDNSYYANNPKTDTIFYKNITDFKLVPDTVYIGDKLIRVFIKAPNCESIGLFCSLTKRQNSDIIELNYSEIYYNSSSSTLETEIHKYFTDDIFTNVEYVEINKLLDQFSIADLPTLSSVGSDRTCPIICFETVTNGVYNSVLRSGRSEDIFSNIDINNLFSVLMTLLSNRSDRIFLGLLETSKN